MILDQVAYLVELAAGAGAAIRFLKPHGALYNQAQRQDEIARGVIEARPNCRCRCWVSPARSLSGWPPREDVRYIAEGFPDRRYRDDGSLVPRTEPDAILHDPVEMEAQLFRLIAAGRVCDALHPRRRSPRRRQRPASPPYPRRAGDRRPELHRWVMGIVGSA